MSFVITIIISLQCQYGSIKKKEIKKKSKVKMFNDPEI